LFWLWVVLGIPGAAIAANNPLGGFGVSCGNLLLVFLWLCIIRGFTPEPEVAAPIRRPVRELVAGLALIGAGVAAVVAFFGILTEDPTTGWTGRLREWLVTVARPIIRLGVPDRIAPSVPNVVLATVATTLPVLVVFLLLGYQRREIGFRRFDVQLVLVLLAVSLLIGLPFGYPLGPPSAAVQDAGLLFLVAAIPEELLYRAYLLPRLVALMRNPIDALVVGAIVFQLAHIPSLMLQGDTFANALVGQLGVAYPSGLVWGYLFLRTRSIWPGAIWHASNSVLGNLFFT